MSTYTQETYGEICEFLELIGNKYKSKIPSNLLELFEENKLAEYVPHINPDVPIKEQSLKEETISLIAFLNLKYWCEDEKEIKRLKEVYENNEKIYQEELRKKYNQNFFKKKPEEQTDKIEMIEYKKMPFYKKLINKIKQLFSKQK